MESADSKIYPGIAREPNTFGTADPNDPAKLMVTTCHPGPYTRRVSVYAPKQYVPGTAAPFIVGADGPDRALFSALDSLIAQRRAPVMIATSIGNGGAMHREASVGLEYDTMSGLYIFARHRARVGSGSHPSGAGACPEPSAYLDYAKGRFLGAGGRNRTCGRPLGIFRRRLTRITITRSPMMAWRIAGWRSDGTAIFPLRGRESERARELDPVSNIINTWVGSRYYFARQYDKAIEQYRTAVEMDPAFVPVHLVLGQAYAQKQMYQEAIAELQRAVTLSGHSPGVCGRSCPRVWCRR